VYAIQLADKGYGMALVLMDVQKERKRARSVLISIPLLAVVSIYIADISPLFRDCVFV
jgi:hypothetical protein